MTDIQTKLEVVDAIDQRRTERRAFLRYAGGGAAAVGGLSLLAACGNDGTSTVTPTPTPTATATSSSLDNDVLNFALNLEYLEAQFYSFAAFGVGLDASLLTGLGTQGSVTGGAQVPFQDTVVRDYAREIALDEIAHVRFLRSALGGSSFAVAQPAIDIRGGAGGPFAAAATAAKIANGSTFNPYADDLSFLYGAFIFEDVGVTAYKGASPLLTNKTYLGAAAGILAAEAYHAGLVRTALYARGLQTPSIRSNTDLISDARDSLDGARATPDLVRGLAADDDQGITGDATTSNIVPTNSNGLTFSRNTDQVLHIVYLDATAGAMSGGFFPAGVNGTIRVAAANPA